MRHGVRYIPLGRKRKVQAEYYVGTERRSREAEVLDESVEGLGLAFPDADGIESGQGMILRTSLGDQKAATVVNIRPLSNNMVRIGLRLKPSSKSTS